MLKIILTSVLVDDQDKALKFYTEVLGFEKKTEFPAGKFRWLTVVPPDNPGGVEITLEPNENPIAKTFQKGLFDSGIPLTAFGVDNIQKEYERMEKMGVVFKTKPMNIGPVTLAVFEDSCGNLIQMIQKN